MDPTIILKRHSQLWEAGNTGIRRTALSGITFAVVILLTVIEPHGETAQRQKIVELTKQEAFKIDTELAQTTAFEARLREIVDNIGMGPWDSVKNNLIDIFRRDLVDNQQAAADQTVHRFAEQIRSEVVAPLGAAVEETGVSGSLAELPGEFGRVIDNW